MECNGYGGNNNRSERRGVAIHPDFLPRTAILGGYIFICNNISMQLFTSRQLFGMPDFYINSVRGIMPGMPLFLYNYETRHLHGIFEATSFGGDNIDPTAWPDYNRNPGRSQFPAQVRVRVRTMCQPCFEGVFAPYIRHYGDNRIRVELTLPEAIHFMHLFRIHNQ